MKSRSLQSKLFFAYISLACLILFSFAVFFYAFVSRQLKQSQISAMNTLNVAAQNLRQNFSTFLSKVFRKYFPI